MSALVGLKKEFDVLYGLKLISPEQYVTTKWKNGGGITQDILMLPKCANHNDFDIRLSTALIVGDSQFSSFSEIDRTITVLAGPQLCLNFPEGDYVEIEKFGSASFDSDRTPSPSSPGEPIKVLNVMTRRGKWRSSVQNRCVNDHDSIEIKDGEIVAIFAINSEITITSLTQEVTIPLGGCLIATTPQSLALVGRNGARALFAIIAPV